MGVVDFTPPSQADPRVPGDFTTVSVTPGEAHIRAVLESTTDSVFALAPDWRFTYLNRRAIAEIADGRELLGAVVWDAFPELAGSDFGAAYRRAMSERVNTEAEQYYPPLSRVFCARAFPAEDGGITVFYRDVTEARDAAARLAEAEGMLRALGEATPDLIYAKDREQRMLYANPATLAMLGRSAAEVLGRTDADWLRDPEEGRRIMETDRQILASGEPATVEEYVTDARIGSVRVWQSTKTPIRDRVSGEVIGLVGVSRDVTALRAAAERDAQLAAIVTSSPDAMMSFDATDGRIRSWNPAAERLFGYSEAEAVGGPFSLLIPPELQGGEQARIFPRVMAGESLSDYETVRMARDGRRIQISVSATRMLARDGRVIGVSAIFRDIGAKKAAEARIRESEARLRLAAEAAEIGVFDWNIRADTLRWDDRLREIWALPPDMPVSMDTFYAGLDPGDVPRLQETVAASFDPAGNGEFAAEYRVRGISGRARVRSIVARGRVTFEDGAPVRMLGMVVDVTAQREAEAVLARDRAELERLVAERTRELEEAQLRLAHARRMEALGQLAGGIAHDFNNVLQAVGGGAALIDRRAESAGEVRRLAQMIAQSAERGAAVTRRLLAFSRRGELRAQPVDVGALLEALHEMLKHTLGRTIVVEVRVEPGLPPLMADKGQLETALVNLAANARDAMPAGGALTMTASLDVLSGSTRAEPRPHSVAGLAAGRYIRLTVSDTGRGMPPAVLARVTEPFFTTKQHGEGTGLGLAIAKSFCEQSGGALSIESAEGIGTRIMLWFPAAAAAAGAELAPGRDARPPPRILLVDDDVLVREMTAEQLESAGSAVVQADGGAAALRALESAERFDVLITDLSMPGMDGIALIRETHRRRPHLPALLLTGYMTDAAELALGEGVAARVALLRKPVTFRQLANELRELVGDDRIGRAPVPTRCERITL